MESNTIFIGSYTDFVRLSGVYRRVVSGPAMKRRTIYNYFVVDGSYIYWGLYSTRDGYKLPYTGRIDYTHQIRNNVELFRSTIGTYEFIMSLEEWHLFQL